MTDNTETVARFGHGDDAYEIDHLGIGSDSQYGEFAVYRGDVQVGSFATEAAGFKPGHRPPLPDAEALIALARQEVDNERYAKQHVGEPTHTPRSTP